MRALATPLLRVAAEGWSVILLLLVTGLWALFSERWLPLGVIVIALGLAIAFFRDLPRHSPAKPLGVLAPVDGTVSFRRECHDPHLGREAIRIGITVPLFCNYLLRAPVEGEVFAVEDAPRSLSGLCTDEGEAILVALRSGSLLGASPVWDAVGHRVGQGRLCGARRLARVIDVYLPAGSRVEVQLGQTVRCGETVLATLLRRSA